VVAGPSERPRVRARAIPESVDFFFAIRPQIFGVGVRGRKIVSRACNQCRTIRNRGQQRSVGLAGRGNRRQMPRSAARAAYMKARGGVNDEAVERRILDQLARRRRKDSPAGMAGWLPKLTIRPKLMRKYYHKCAILVTDLMH
jgi:hypothetical protein